MSSDQQNGSHTMNNATKTQLITEATQRITHAVKHGVSISWGVRVVHENGRLASIANGVALELFETVTIPEYSRETVLHSALNDQSNLNALTGLCHDFAIIKRDTEQARAPLLSPNKPDTHRANFTIIWNRADVRSQWPDATDAQCAAVFDYLERTFDATIGVTWDVIDDACIEVQKA